MGILRKRNQDQVNPEPEKEIRIRLGSATMKSSLVSGVVQQLKDQGYSGDLLTNSSMRYDIPNPAMESEIESSESIEMMDGRLVVDDIDFDATKKPDEVRTKMSEKEPLTKRELKQRSNQRMEEKTANSQQQIDYISKSSKKLFSDIDHFIGDLRKAANNARDNKRLCMKLERLRQLCVSFTRGVQGQIPGYAVSLFVELEDESNE